MKLTDKEDLVIEKLVDAWNAFLLLPHNDYCNYDDDIAVFRHGIHILQDMIAARPIYRQLRETGK